MKKKEHFLAHRLNAKCIKCPLQSILRKGSKWIFIPKKNNVILCPHNWIILNSYIKIFIEIISYNKVKTADIILKDGGLGNERAG